MKNLALALPLLLGACASAPAGDGFVPIFDGKTLEINGRTTAQLIDRERGKAAAEGVLAMPVIPEPMKVQYKDLRLRTLPQGPPASSGP